MAQTVPSQIIEYIDRRFPEVRGQSDDKATKVKLGVGYYAPIATLVELLEKLPPNLLLISGETYIQFMEAINELKKAILYWNSDHISKMKHVVYKVSDTSQLNPVTIVRDALSRCPDQGVEEKTSGLIFIVEENFRETLRQDISFVNQSLANAEWKSSTVLAGSVIEALLLDAISYIKQNNTIQFQDIIKTKILNPNYSMHLDNKPENNPNNWALYQFIPFAHLAGLITEITAKGCLEAKDFRNLIHPGKSVRKNIACDRGTALKSVGAMEHVIKDLSIAHPSLSHI